MSNTIVHNTPLTDIGKKIKGLQNLQGPPGYKTGLAAADFLLHWFKLPRAQKWRDRIGEFGPPTSSYPVVPD